MTRKQYQAWRQREMGDTADKVHALLGLADRMKRAASDIVRAVDSKPTPKFNGTHTHYPKAAAR